MTGYAVKTRDLECGSLQIELKSVNSRYLDFHFRVTEDLRALEMPLREMLSARLTRGKIECRLSFNAAAARAEQLQLNAELLAALNALGEQVRRAVEVLIQALDKADQDRRDNCQTGSQSYPKQSFRTEDSIEEMSTGIQTKTG